MVTMTKISQHGKSGSGSATANGGMINVKNVGWAQYVIVWGTGSNTQSRTMHCSEAQATAFKDSLKD